MKMHLGTRLGIAFGLISCIVFLSIGGLSYHNMQQMVQQAEQLEKVSGWKQLRLV